MQRGQAQLIKARQEKGREKTDGRATEEQDIGTFFFTRG